ncbi:cell wall-binding repeat-containing protein [Rossellomorea aquimaris]|uniref:cell wall-binding repeat-containing protein n=1 Tax=Rossellomorea aquimaris TaxID=189382 RepID=UPI001CD731A4|nr:cell wall-binding repeat-containing protein [Rossellomorea aquimaris]MCA1060812.1 cell wall-binding repeat-containing protein [Rossellomorea aquimaris]
MSNYRKPVSITFVTVVSIIFLIIFQTPAAAAGTQIDRVSGVDRYETAIKVSKQGWNSADTVVIAVGNNFPDALAGAPLADKYNAPILLVTEDSVPYSVKEELKRLNPNKAYILGGDSVIAPSVENQIKNLGIKSIRVAGENRYETAAKIAELVGGSQVIVTYGKDFPDSLAIAPVAASKSMPILLTEKNYVPEETKKALSKYQSSILVGGTGVVSENVKNQLPRATRISGKDRYETATKVAEKYYSGSNSTVIAAGDSYADALTGSVLAAKKGSPVMLVQSNNVPTSVKSTVDKLGINQFTIIGGTSVISEKAQSLFGFDTDSLIRTAKQYIGTPYKWGGTTPSGFDCSGYLNFVYDKYDIDLPRTTSDIWNFGSRSNSPEVGDIVMFETYKPGPSHGGIYIGGNQFIHAGNDGVEITSMGNVYWKPRYLGAVKVIN